MPPASRVPVAPLTDLDRAFALIPEEPSAAPVLAELLAPLSLPTTGHAVVLRSRLGGLARAFAERQPSWRVTALDPSVALLSASLDAIRPAGLGSQLTVMQGALHTLPLPDADVDLLLGDLPLGTLRDAAELARWAAESARVLRPGRWLAVRCARRGVPSPALTQALAPLSPGYAALVRPEWSAAFTDAAVSAALRAAGFEVSHLPAGAVHTLLVARR